MKNASRPKSWTKWVLAGLCLSLVVLSLLAYFSRETILEKAGGFMAPRGDYEADIAIVGGTSFLDRPVAEAGIELLMAGKVKRLAVVLHNINPQHRPLGLNDNYPGMVRQEMLKRGLAEKDFEIIIARIDHPVTLTEAQNAMKAIAKQNVKSAILLAPGFHTRRSYLVYQHAADPYNIKIYPQACFAGNGPGKWWTENSGMRHFAEETVKLAYYMLCGYIPFKFAY